MGALSREHSLLIIRVASPLGGVAVNCWALFFPHPRARPANSALPIPALPPSLADLHSVREAKMATCMKAVNTRAVSVPSTSARAEKVSFFSVPASGCMCHRSPREGRWAGCGLHRGSAQKRQGRSGAFAEARLPSGRRHTATGQARDRRSGSSRRSVASAGIVRTRGQCIRHAAVPR